MQEFCSSVALLFLLQIQYGVAADCNIVSVTSPSASTLDVTWSKVAGSSYYVLDLRVVNSTTIPQIKLENISSTQRLVQGLRAGQVYQVTLSAFDMLFYPLCTVTKITMTVPAASQITSSQAISSTSIKFTWSTVTGAESYILFLKEQYITSPKEYNRTFTTSCGQMDGLTPSTYYEYYIYSSNSAGRGAQSKIQTITTLVSPPTGVNLITTGKSTARVTWEPRNKVLLYQVSLRNNGNPDKPPVLRNTSSTSMEISNLDPCSTYTVGVSSFSLNLVPGEPSAVTYNTTTIDGVRTVSVDYSCSINRVTVTWDLVLGATKYRAEAVDITGASLNCTSNSTSCQIRALKCGENYQVHVTAISDDCESISNVTSTFETVPCAPADLKITHDCSANVIDFSWQPTNNTYYYVATAVDNTGNVAECWTFDSLCHFTNVDCGQVYTYRVYGVSPGCNSQISQPKYTQTSPCLPTNVRTEANCFTNTLVTTWDSSEGALSYTVKAEGNNGETYSCSSPNNTCEIAGVPCGEQLSVWILASNDYCSTGNTLVKSAQTAPCTPTIVSASAECSPDSATVKWTQNHGAIFYIALAEDSNGNSHNCYSLETTCLIENLGCGRNYTIRVIGTNLDCNSTASQEAHFRTGPCPPSGIDVFRDCDANHAVIVWQNLQTPGVYTATLKDQSGPQLNCTSNTVNNCTIVSPPCGKKYNVTVTYSDGQCRSTSASTSMDTVPCGPEDVHTRLSCSSDELQVSWNSSVPTENYTTIISRAKGPPLYCNSTVTQCTMGGLRCESSYTVTVFSITGTCRSLPSQEVVVQTLPCPPTNVTAVHACAPDPIPVSWTHSGNAELFVAVALGSRGHRAECTTNKTSCSLPGLQCGEVYTVSVVGANDNCSGLQSSPLSLKTEPCSPSNVTSQVICGARAAQVFWSPRMNADSYNVRATSPGQSLTCSSSSSNCTLTPVVCGQAYDVQVSASDGTCTSNYSSPFRQEPVPCAPENVSATTLCSTRSALITWVGSPGAIGHNVTVTGRDGHAHHCHTNATSCHVTDLHCGETYSVTATPYSQTCTGARSAAHSFRAGLCAPSNVTASPGCEDSAVSWTPVTGADMYIATATADDGHNHTCSSNFSGRCNFTSLHCGETYAVRVVTVDQGCWSKPSSAVQLRAALCPPANLTGLVSCETNTLSLTWGPVTGATYVLQWEGLGSTSPPSGFITSNTSHSLPNLLCGERYTFRVAAQDTGCRSIYSPPVEIRTAPCQPTNLTVRVDCGTNNGNFSWAESSGASSYVVEITGEHGHVASCSSSGTSCAVKLHCGRSYSATLVASTESCNSTEHADIHFDSAPCLPGDVMAELDCDTNTMSVNWTQTTGSDEYTAWAVSTDGHRASCNSTSNRCSIHGLRCGRIYEVAVTSSSIDCDVIAGSDYKVQSAPCKAENATAKLNCSSNVMTVKWQEATTAQNYTVRAASGSGVNSTCDATEGSCSFLDLSCGQLYTFTVTGYTNVCVSDMSHAVERHTAPCPPTSVSADLNCTTRKALISWTKAAAAVPTAYSALATSSAGHNASCSDMGTSCDLEQLLCGQRYSVVVQAIHAGCPGPASAPVTFSTAPCLPGDVAAEVSCESDSNATVSWSTPSPLTSISKPTNFSVTAIVGGSLQTLCTTQRSFCNVKGFSCGQTYNLSLTATNEQCSLTAHTPVSITTRPCAPQRLSVSLLCGLHSAVLSWDERPDAEVHTASAVKSSGGELRTCNSSGSSCKFTGLDCGEMYNFTVAAFSGGCWSQASSITLIQTEPCRPLNVSAQTFCDSEEVQLSWYQTGRGANYSVIAMGSLGYMGVYNTTGTLYSATLPCGQHYNVTVQAQSGRCHSMPSSPFFFKTGPCIPRDVVTAEQCGSSVGSVSWGPSDGAECYIARATGLDGHVHLCHTNTTSCTWSDLHCGEQYAVTVGAKADHCIRFSGNSSIIYMNSCRPQNLAASVDCDKKVVSLGWDTNNRTETYMVSAETGDRVISLSTNITTALFSEFTCGQNYSLTVTPYNQHCPGNSSASTSVQTWPCMPEGISATQDCFSGIAVVTWSPSRGSVYYTAAMQTDAGVSKMCVSDSGACSLSGLTCGHNFSVSVTASNQQCNVTSRETASLQSGPCIPTDVSVKMACSNNSAAVSWSPSPGARRYSLLANSSHSDDSCTASDLSCLACGANYTVQVVAADDRCSSRPSQPVLFESGPCPPHNLNAQLSCLSNNLTVTWNALRHVDHFLVSLTAADGGIDELCNTTSNACSTSNLPCGHTYAVQVTSVRGGCQSEHNQSRSIHSAPCKPQGVSGHLDCVTNSAWISWEAAPGAESYTVSAVGGDAYTANCTTSNTSCEVEDLACGVSYSFTVTARNSRCESPPSASISLRTAPCSLSGITAFAQCHNSSILVEWGLTEGGAENTLHIATAEASDYTYLICNSTGGSCLLQGARCGLRYTIIVAASSDRCSSLRSPPYRISMEPCAPGDVSVDVSCEHHSALVSWTPSPVADTYQVFAVAADGHERACNTTSSNCTVSELHCDQRYTVFVVASHENCTSKASRNATVITGPCQPSGLSRTFHCDNQSAALTWVPSDNAEDYHGCAQAENGDRLCCHSTEPGCTINRLVCGKVYNFTVQASNRKCNSSFSDAVQIAGAPCPPQFFEVQQMPMKMETQVMHFSWTEVTCGEPEYLLNLAGSLLGDSHALFEISSYWTNVRYFEIPLPCGSSYVATLRSRNAAGMSDKSAPLNGTTAPCPPSGAKYSGSSSSVSVWWNSSVFATTYSLYNGSVSPQRQLCSTAGLSCSLSNVSFSSLVVTASSAAGESQPANVMEVTSTSRRRRELREKRIRVNGDLSAPLLDVTQAPPTTVFLQWSPVEDASFYSLLVRKQGSSDQELTVYGESIILSDLSPDSAYCFSVRPAAADVSGPESEPVCVKTGRGRTQLGGEHAA